MSEMEPGHLTPKDAAAQDAVRGLPNPSAQPEFREKLRKQFAAGQIPPSRRPAARIWRWSASLAAATFALCLVYANQGPTWRAHGSRGTGAVRIDGVSHALATLEEIQAFIRPGASIALEGEAELDLVLPGNFFFQLASGARITLPAAPGRWWGRASRGSVDAGELRVTTGPDFGGARLLLDLHESVAEATGTTFAAIRNGNSTCVCTLEGEVWMSDADGQKVCVAAGRRRDARAQDRGLNAILPMERMKLSMLKESGNAVFEEW